MATEPWDIRPARNRIPVTPKFQTEVETKAGKLIETVLKPKHVQPPKPDEQFNYIVDITAKWYRGFFYFSAIFANPSQGALSPTFEWKFARMEPIRSNKFALYAMRHTGNEWVGVLDDLSLDACLQSIANDPWFEL